jgi:PAS domain S-box-containing protein
MDPITRIAHGMNNQFSQSAIAEARHLLDEIQRALGYKFPARSTEATVPSSTAAPGADNQQEAFAGIVADLRSLLDKVQRNKSAGASGVADQKEQDSLFPGTTLVTKTLASIGEAVVTLDADGKVVFVNKAAESLTGLTFAELTGRPLEPVLEVYDEKNHTERLPAFIDRCLASTDTELRDDRRCMIRSRSGAEQIIEYQGTKILDGNKYVGAVLVFRDITKGYFLEEELLKIRKLESVGVLAGGIAHDFNNLLTGITTYLFMARMSAASNKEASSLIAEAEKAAFKASTLTKQLLSFSKGGPSVKEPASVKQLIQDTVGFCLSGSNVDYRLELPDDLATVEVDRGQIDQVFNNLILNAVQAMPDGGTMTISAENWVYDETAAHGGTARTLPLQPGNYVKISIEDEGVGIPREHLDRLFDPYFTTKKEGSGLGLTTAYSIIKKHGGHISVETAKGKGSVFTFFLPAKVVVNGSKSLKEISLPMGTGKVLIMDDDVIVRTVVETLLKKAGYTAVCAANGTQALEFYKESLAHNDPFTVTIMDLTIPGGMGGKETVKQLREIDPTAKVIVFSGYSNDPIFSKYREFGFDGVLSKPFSIEEFMRTISEVLQDGESAENNG